MSDAVFFTDNALNFSKPNEDFEQLHGINGNLILNAYDIPIYVRSDHAKEDCMMPFWNETITVYNKRMDCKNGVTKWFVHVVEHCFWCAICSSEADGPGRSHRESVLVRVPYNRYYRTPQQWDLCPDGFTLRPGDLVFRGNVCVPIADIAGQRVNDRLNEMHPNCFTIRTVCDNANPSPVLKHLRIEGF